MLEVPLEWIEFPDLMMEDEDVPPATKATVKRKIDDVAQGWRRWQKKDDISPEKRAHSPQCHREHKIQRNSILKIAMKHYRKKMNGGHQINGKGLHRWYFLVNV